MAPSSQANTSRRSFWLRRIRGLFLFVLASIAFLEVLLRITGGSVPEPPYYPGDIVLASEPDPSYNELLGWTFPPDIERVLETDEYSFTLRTNSQGFRASREFEPVAPDQTLIAFLGASFTAGGGVEEEETFVSLIEQQRENTVCYNFAAGAYGLDQMYLALKHYALPLEPDIVVLSLVRSVLVRSTTAYRFDSRWRSKPTFTLVNGELERLTAENSPSKLWRFIQQNSRIHGVLRKVEASILRHAAIGPQARLNRTLLERIRDECQEAGARLLVVNIPVNRRKPIPMLKQEFESLEVEYLDLQPLLPEDSDRLYYRIDGHFNLEGHRSAAATIGRTLTSE